MCGIYGIIGLKDKKLLSQMGKTLAHRGPDDQKELVEGELGLGYRRLAIIDTSGSYQPLWNEDKTIALFFNGEIYNYKNLREKLRKHKFKTNGDGETIIHWYEEHGINGFQDLIGIFAFSLFDKKKNKLIIARDHLGVKPVYYQKTDKKILFASEIKAILKVTGKQKANEKVMEKYLLKRFHDDTDETFFKNIRRIPAGSALVWDIKKRDLEIKQYWKLQENQNLLEKSDSENILKFKKLFLKSVDLQLASDVPLGTALSGGLDSSAVVMAAERPGLKTFSAVFPGEINNEKDYIDEVVKASGVENFTVKPDRENFWTDLEKLIKAQDEPMISSGPYAQWRVQKLAREKGIKVMLDGQGADEMLAGYDPYFFVYYRELIKKRKFFLLFQEILQNWKMIKKYVFAKKPFDIKPLFNFPAVSETSVVSDDLNQRLKVDLLQNSLPPLLRYEDHNSMAHSIEARVPFLDKDLVEFTVSLPSNYKIRNGLNKWIMRQALKDLLPKKILERTWKVGFTTPEIAWLRKSEKEVMGIFISDTFRSRKYFNASEIIKRFKEFLEDKNDESMVFWRIINLELWLRIYID